MYVFVSCCIACIMYEYASICMYMLISACMCVYLLVLTCISMYLHVFDFLFCTQHKREKVAQARTWCPAMCYQKAIKRAAKPLRWFWDSNTRLHSDMYPYVPLSQPWLWHYVEFVGIYMLLCKIHTHTDNTFIYIHIRTQYMHIHTYTCTYMLIVASYIHIHACANHGREGSLGGCGRRCMSQGATKLPQ